MIKSIEKWKRAIAVRLGKNGTDSLLYRVASSLNLLFFHKDDRMQWIQNGDEDPDTTYYVIRPSSTSEGLLSSYFTVVNQIRWADDQQYIPFVDFEDEKCQYFTGRQINGTRNAWEYYFEQPSDLTAEELKRKKNILLSGISDLRTQSSETRFEGTGLDQFRTPDKMDIYKRISVVSDLRWDARRKEEALFGKTGTLGVLIRGTDYISLKPKGHPIQPSIEMVADKIDEYIRRYPIDRVFVVTEDYTYYQILQDRFGDMVVTSDDDFVTEYREGTYIADTFRDDPYLRGRNYLIRLLLLSRCDYLISGITNGSIFAYCQKTGDYKASYWFQLGLYA